LSNVLPLFRPHQSRSVELRQWFMQQAREPAGHVAAVSISITADGMVNTGGCGVEPHHALTLLDELEEVRERLEVIAGVQARGAVVQRGRVVPFQRAAQCCI